MAFISKYNLAAQCGKSFCQYVRLSNALLVRNNLQSLTEHRRATHESAPPIPSDKIKIVLKTSKEVFNVQADKGDSIYDAIIDNNCSITGFGACEGTMACSTCHVILSESDYQRHNLMSEEEEDLLEMLYSRRRDTSRLGCQVTLTSKCDGMVVDVPDPLDVRNL